MLTVNTLNAL